MNDVELDRFNIVIERFYKLLPEGENFSDFTHGIFRDDIRSMMQVQSTLFQNGFLMAWGDSGKVSLTYQGQQMWERYGCYDKYQKQRKKEKEAQLNNKITVEQKLLNDAKLSKWQAKTFWPVFIFVVVGSVCGVISLVIQIVSWIF